MLTICPFASRVTTVWPLLWEPRSSSVTTLQRLLVRFCLWEDLVGAGEAGEGRGHGLPFSGPLASALQQERRESELSTQLPGRSSLASP